MHALRRIKGVVLDAARAHPSKVETGFVVAIKLAWSIGIGHTQGGPTRFYDVVCNVERSCAEDSSPKNCSDSINFYNVYFNNRFMTNPNILTILPKILFTEFQNNQYSTPGETLANSMKVDMYQSGSILISENNNKVIFTVDYEDTIPILPPVVPKKPMAESIILFVPFTAAASLLLLWVFFLNC